MRANALSGIKSRRTYASRVALGSLYPLAYVRGSWFSISCRVDIAFGVSGYVLPMGLVICTDGHWRDADRVGMRSQ